MAQHVIQQARGTPFADSTIYSALSTSTDASLDDTTTRSPMTHLIDCYCGSGLFAISAAALVPDLQRVLGIEINAHAVEEAQENARLNNVTVYFVALSVSAIFA
jgi:tRNA (uracil-5-)-methyltransferase